MAELSFGCFQSRGGWGGASPWVAKDRGTSLRCLLGPLWSSTISHQEAYSLFPEAKGQKLVTLEEVLPRVPGAGWG